MKSKSISIPIYCCKLTMIIDENLSYVEKNIRQNLFMILELLH